MRGFPCSFGQTLAFLRVDGVRSLVSREKLSRFARRGADHSRFKRCAKGDGFGCKNVRRGYEGGDS